MPTMQTVRGLARRRSRPVKINPARLGRAVRRARREEPSGGDPLPQPWPEDGEPTQPPDPCIALLVLQFTLVWGPHPDHIENAAYLINLVRGRTPSSANQILFNALSSAPLAQEIPPVARPAVHAWTITAATAGGCLIGGAFAGVPEGRMRQVQVPTPADGEQLILDDCAQALLDAMEQRFGTHHDAPGIAWYLMNIVRGKPYILAQAALTTAFKTAPVNNEIPSNLVPWFMQQTLQAAQAHGCLGHGQQPRAAHRKPPAPPLGKVRPAYGASGYDT